MYLIGKNIDTQRYTSQRCASNLLR